MATTTDRFPGITCTCCCDRLAECPTNESGFPMARELFEVGNQAAPDMGHAIYHCRDGRTALCAAKRS